MSNPVDKVACRAIIMNGNKIFAVRMVSAPDFYVLPGGKIDKMETLENCMAREIEEELGVKPVLGQILFIHQGLLSTYNKHVLEFFFLVTNGEDFANIDISKTTHGYELSEIRRIDTSEEGIELMPRFVIEELKGMTLEQIKKLSTKSVISY